MNLPRLYAIVDASNFADTSGLLSFVEALLVAGVTLVQYRNKQGSAREMLSQARELRRVVGPRARLIMNDRVDLCVAARFDGVHVGQEDLSPDSVRKLLDAADAGNRLWMGVSTHTPEQIRAAGNTDADYLAIGPVYQTSSKANPDPVVGLKGVSLARDLTQKPLVAIGGITRGNARAVIDAGADAVAVISDLVLDPRRAAEEFLQLLA